MKSSKLFIGTLLVGFIYFMADAAAGSGDKVDISQFIGVISNGKHALKSSLAKSCGIFTVALSASEEISPEVLSKHAENKLNSFLTKSKNKAGHASITSVSLISFVVKSDNLFIDIEHPGETDPFRSSRDYPQIPAQKGTVIRVSSKSYGLQSLKEVLEAPDVIAKRLFDEGGSNLVILINRQKLLEQLD